MTANTLDLPSLRPLGMAQLLDRAIRLYRRQFPTLIGILAVVIVPVTALRAVATFVNASQMAAALERMGDASSGPGQIIADTFTASSGGLINLLVSLLYLILIQGVAGAALARTLGDQVVGEKIGILEAYGSSSAVLGRVLVLLILAGLLTGGLMIFALIPCVGWTAGMGVLIYFPAVIYQFIVPVLVLENKSPGAALRRGWDLARRRFWWNLGFMLAVWLLSLVILRGPLGLLTYGLLSAVGSFLPNLDSQMTLVASQSIGVFVQLVSDLMLFPLQMAAAVTLYFDLRVRTEAFDIAAQTAPRDEAGAIDVEALIEQSPPPERGALVTGTEMLNFVGVGVGTMVIVGLFYGGLIALTLLFMAATFGF